MPEMEVSDIPATELGIEHVEMAPGVGDQIDAKARHYADLINSTETMTAMRERRLSPERYRSFILEVYPLVVGFNFGLIHSLAKVHDELDRSQSATELVNQILQTDHIRHSGQIQELAAELRLVAKRDNLPVLRALAGQLKEEQEHNDYYREMLEAHGIQNHEELYTQFQEYLAGIPVEDRDRMVDELAGAATQEDNQKQVFPNTQFNQAVLALSHYLSRASTNPEVKFITYHALTSAIEFTLINGVSESIYPGLSGPNGEPPYNLELVPDTANTPPGEIPRSVKWFDEHAQQGRGGRIEMQHKEHGLQALNNAPIEPEDVQETLARVDVVLGLFARSVT